MSIIARSGPGRGRIDWERERDRIDLAAVVTGFLGPAPGRRGERGRWLWWRCPFHDDGNPSFKVEPGKPWWRCFGCGEHGDAATLVMKLRGVSFPEALDILTDRRAGPRAGTAPRPATVQPAAPRPTTRPEAPTARGMKPEAAAALVGAAADRLWTPEGADALAYLHGRGLTDETIRAARLGWLPKGNPDVPWKAPGVVVPWHDKGRVALVKLRVDAAWRATLPPGRSQPPKYIDARYRHPEVPHTVYPSPETIRVGRPLVVVEGEFDALLLGQALGDRAAVVTLGSAGAGLAVPILGRVLGSLAWFIATDSDSAGDKAADAWKAYPRARRIRPPGAFKDWTEAASGGADLARWWSDVLNGNLAPSLFTWEELSTWRWGPALSDGPEAPTDEGGPAMDAYAIAEREAIQGADGPSFILEGNAP